MMLAEVSVNNFDVYRTAKLFVDKHGAEAPIHAAMKVDEMLEKGDMDGRAVWLRVVKAIEQTFRGLARNVRSWG